MFFNISMDMDCEILPSDLPFGVQQLFQGEVKLLKDMCVVLDITGHSGVFEHDADHCTTEREIVLDLHDLVARLKGWIDDDQVDGMVLDGKGMEKFTFALQPEELSCRILDTGPDASRTANDSNASSRGDTSASEDDDTSTLSAAHQARLTAQKCFLRGQRLYQRQDYSNACREFMQALARHTGEACYHAFAAHTYCMLEKYQEAQDHVLEAFELDANHVEAHLVKADIEHRSKGCDEAILYLERVTAGNDSAQFKKVHKRLSQMRKWQSEDTFYATSFSRTILWRSSVYYLHRCFEESDAMKQIDLPCIHINSSSLDRVAEDDEAFQRDDMPADMTSNEERQHALNALSRWEARVVVACNDDSVDSELLHLQHLQRVIREIDSQEVTEDRKKQLIHQYLEEMDPAMPQPACAACGVRAFVKDAEYGHGFQCIRLLQGFRGLFAGISTGVGVDPRWRSFLNTHQNVDSTACATMHSLPEHYFDPLIVPDDDVEHYGLCAEHTDSIPEPVSIRMHSCTDTSTDVVRIELNPEDITKVRLYFNDTLVCNDFQREHLSSCALQGILLLHGQHLRHMQAVNADAVSTTELQDALQQRLHDIQQLLDRADQEHTRRCRRIRSVYNDKPTGRWLYLHPELVEQHDEGALTLTICRQCHHSLLKSTVPTYSIADGYDFGLAKRFGNLPNLSLLERYVICLVRPCAVVIKAVVNSSRPTSTVLHGHIISFPSFGPRESWQLAHDQANSTVLPTAAGIENWITVAMVCESRYKDVTMAGLLEFSQLRCNFDSVMMWLRFLKKAHPAYANVDLATSAATREEIQALPAKLVETAMVITSDEAMALEQCLGSNVAHARVNQFEDTTAEHESLQDRVRGLIESRGVIDSARGPRVGTRNGTQESRGDASCGYEADDDACDDDETARAHDAQETHALPSQDSMPVDMTGNDVNNTAGQQTAPSSDVVCLFSHLQVSENPADTISPSVKNAARFQAIARMMSSESSERLSSSSRTMQIRLKPHVVLQKGEVLEDDPCPHVQEDEDVEFNLFEDVRSGQKTSTVRYTSNPFRQGDRVEIVNGKDTVPVMITAVQRCKFGDITDDVLEREGIAAKGERGRVQLRRLLFKLTSTWYDDAQIMTVYMFRKMTIEIQQPVTLFRGETLVNDPAGAEQQEPDQTFHVFDDIKDGLRRRIVRYDRESSNTKTMFRKDDIVAITDGGDSISVHIRAATRYQLRRVPDSVLASEQICARNDDGRNQLRRLIYKMTDRWLQDQDYIEVYDIDLVAPGSDPNCTDHLSRAMSNPGSDTRPTTLRVDRLTDAINEFEENDRLFLTAFPIEFCTGVGVRRKGKFDSKLFTRLVRQFHNMFSENKMLMMLYMNQSQRHSVIAEVNATLRNRPDAIEFFSQRFDDEEFQGKLAFAQEHPTSATARQVLKEISKFINVPGRKVPFSPIERQEFTTQMYAVSSRFGSPSVWLTLNPYDGGSPLMLRASFPTVFPNAFPATTSLHPTEFGDSFFDAIERGCQSITIPDRKSTHPDAVAFAEPIAKQVLLRKYDVERYAVEHPVACAELFKRTIDSVFKVLLNLQDHKHVRKSECLSEDVGSENVGIFGHSRVALGTIEEQKRGALHMHLAVWCSISPVVIQQVASCPALTERIQRVLESQFVAHVPPQYHLRNMVAKQNAVRAKGVAKFFKRHILDSVPETIDMEQGSCHPGAFQSAGVDTHPGAGLYRDGLVALTPAAQVMQRRQQHKDTTNVQRRREIKEEQRAWFQNHFKDRDEQRNCWTEHHKERTRSHLEACFRAPNTETPCAGNSAYSSGADTADRQISPDVDVESVMHQLAILHPNLQQAIQQRHDGLTRAMQSQESTSQTYDNLFTHVDPGTHAVVVKAWERLRAKSRLHTHMQHASSALAATRQQLDAASSSDTGVKHLYQQRRRQLGTCLRIRDQYRYVNEFNENSTFGHTDSHDTHRLTRDAEDNLYFDEDGHCASEWWSATDDGGFEKYEPAQMIPAMPLEQYSALDHLVYEEMVSKQMHEHGESCRKTKKGSVLCRFGYPQPLVNQTGPVEIDMSSVPETIPHLSKRWHPDVLSHVAPLAPFECTCTERKAQDCAILQSDQRVIAWHMHRPRLHPPPVSDVYQIQQEIENMIRCQQPPGQVPFQMNPSAFSRYRLSPEGVQDIILRLQKRNGRIVETNAVLMAVLQANTNATFLGSSEQAKAILFYLAKYLTKDKVALGATLSLIAHARKHVTEFPSTAADSGSRDRSVKHIMQRLLNEFNGSREIGDQQCALLSLGVQAHINTALVEDSCKIYPAIAYVVRNRRERRKLAERQDATATGSDGTSDSDDNSSFVEESEHGGSTTVSSHSDVDGTNPGRADGSSSEENVTPRRDNVSKPRQESYTFGADAGRSAEDYEDLQRKARGPDAFSRGDGAVAIVQLSAEEKRKVPISQHECYAHRGNALAQLCLYEYVAMVRRDRRTEKNNPGSRGRQSNGTFAFDEGFVLYDGNRPFDEQFHIQVLKSKYSCPILAGAPPPMHPGPFDGTSSWWKKANTFATYFLTLFVPWKDKYGPACSLTWASLERYVHQLSTSITYCLRQRLYTMQNIMHLNVGRSTVRAALEAHRFRQAHRWGHNRNASSDDDDDRGCSQGSRIYSADDLIAAKNAIRDAMEAQTRRKTDDQLEAEVMASLQQQEAVDTAMDYFNPHTASCTTAILEEDDLPLRVMKKKDIRDTIDALKRDLVTSSQQVDTVDADTDTSVRRHSSADESSVNNQEETNIVLSPSQGGFIDEVVEWDAKMRAYLLDPSHVPHPGQAPKITLHGGPGKSLTCFVVLRCSDCLCVYVVSAM